MLRYVVVGGWVGGRRREGEREREGESGQRGREKKESYD
jgi:hypothetical protein